jgi:hypothetical protein
MYTLDDFLNDDFYIKIEQSDIPLLSGLQEWLQGHKWVDGRYIDDEHTTGYEFKKNNGQPMYIHASRYGENCITYTIYRNHITKHIADIRDIVYEDKYEFTEEDFAQLFS